MQVQENVSLKPYNSFKVDVTARYFARVTTQNELAVLLKDKKYIDLPSLILGSGSNTLFTHNYGGLVVKLEFLGISVIENREGSITLEVGAGESWNGLVQYAINNGFAGIENMTLIPGTVGAAPIQNIAAYGQNFEDVFVSLDAYELASRTVKKFGKKECQFAYRDSFFKNEGKGKYIITCVRIKLKKQPEIDMSYHSRYESLVGELEQFTQPPYTIRDISRAVARIRERKFPDWEKNGTAGSFFLNPVISKQKLAELQKKVPEVQYYPVDKLTYPTPHDPEFDHDNHVKVAAGWLLEELGWKGKREGNVATSPNQSLVVMTYGEVKAKEILDFTNKMQTEFEEAYGIKLEPEVNII